MKKLRLNLDALEVETFEAVSAEATRESGTVEANQIGVTPTRYSCVASACPWADTCDDFTCGGDTCGACPSLQTCEQSCYGTCDVTCIYC